MADLKEERKSETCVDADKFVAKCRDIGTPLLVSINVVRIYCRVVNSIYIPRSRPARRISPKCIKYGFYPSCFNPKHLPYVSKPFVFNNLTVDKIRVLPTKHFVIVKRGIY